MTHSKYNSATYGNLLTSTGTTGDYLVSDSFNTTWNSALRSATLELHGEDADIKINGESLMSTLQEIQNHLRIHKPVARDVAAEAEWAELQAAGEHYNSLLKQYKEKQKIWDNLKKEY